MAEPITETPSSTASSSRLPPSTPDTPIRKTIDKRLEEEGWEEYHPSQDEDSVDDTASRASSSRLGTPIAKTRTRQGTRNPEITSPRRNATPVRRRKTAPQTPVVRVEKGISTPKRESRPVTTIPDRPRTQTSSIVNYLILLFSTLLSILQRTILFGISILSTILAPYLLPLFLTLSAILIAGLSTYFLLPLLPSFLVNLTAKALRTIIPGTTWAVGSLSNLGITRSAAIVPARILVTPACTLLGLGCQYSLLSTVNPRLIELDAGEYEEKEGITARPFWKWDWSVLVPDLGLSGRGSGVNVAGVARGLGREVKQARDIFESVQSMSSAGLVRNLHYKK